MQFFGLQTANQSSHLFSMKYHLVLRSLSVCLPVYIINSCRMLCLSGLWSGIAFVVRRVLFLVLSVPATTPHAAMAGGGGVEST